MIAEKGMKLSSVLAISKLLLNSQTSPQSPQGRGRTHASSEKHTQGRELSKRELTIVDIIVLYEDILENNKIVKKVALIHQGKVIYVKMDPLQFFTYKFICKVVSRFNLITSDCKILSLSGHGEGWFMHDTGMQNIVKFNDVSRALRNVNVCVDLLALDLCFGAGVEIIYEFRDVVRFLIASQEDLYNESIIPGFVELHNCMDMNDMVEIGKHYIKRSDDKSEPTSITIIDVVGIVKLINQAMELKWTIEDLHNHIVDDSETYCPSSINTDVCESCDLLECNLFRDFLLLMIDKLSKPGNPASKFRDQFNEYCRFYKTRYCHTAGTGINFSLPMWLNNTSSTPLFNKAYHELAINRK